MMGDLAFLQGVQCRIDYRFDIREEVYAYQPGSMLFEQFLERIMVEVC